MNVHSPGLPRNRLKTENKSRRWRNNPICRLDQGSRSVTGTTETRQEFNPHQREHSSASLSVYLLPTESTSQVGSDSPTIPSVAAETGRVRSYPTTRGRSDREAYNETSHYLGYNTDTLRFTVESQAQESYSPILAKDGLVDSANYTQVYSEKGSDLLPQPLPPALPQTQQHVSGQSSSKPGQQDEHFPHWSVEPSQHYWNFDSQQDIAHPAAERFLQAEVAPLVNPVNTQSLLLSGDQVGGHRDSTFGGFSAESPTISGHNSTQSRQPPYSSGHPEPRATLPAPRSILPALETYHYSTGACDDQPSTAVVNQAVFPETASSAPYHHPLQHADYRQSSAHRPQEQYWSSSSNTIILPHPTRPERRAGDSSPSNFSHSPLHQTHQTSQAAMGGGTGDPWVEVPACSQPYEESHYASSRPGVQYVSGDGYQDVLPLPMDDLTSHMKPRSGSMLKQPYDPTPGRTEKRTSKNKTCRKPFDPLRKKATAETRLRGACIRCRTQKLRCDPLYPEDPLGPCIECHKVNTASKKTTRSADCLHHNLRDLQLARQGSLNLTSRWSGTKMHDVDCLASSSIRTVEFKIFYTHDPNLPEFYHVPVQLQVRRFIPKDGDVLDRKWTWDGYGMVTRLAPFALHSIHATATAISRYIEENAFIAMTASVAGCDPIIRDTYTMAIRHWYTLDSANDTRAAERRFLSRLFKVWFAMRLSTGSAYLSGHDKLDMEPELRPGYPLGDRISLPRMVTAQIDSILTTKIIQDETTKLKRELSDLFKSNNPQYWFTLYVATFILLHEISVATQDRGRYARQNQLPTRFSLPSLVAAQHRSATSLLAHWHYFKSGRDPRNTEMHDTERTPMKYLTQEQKHVIWPWWRRMTDPAIMQENCPDDPREQDRRLEDPLYFVSQMFIEGWSARAVFLG
ncbi:hypothetical protein MGG_05459 [Pyricularia oryzae 70-15]|uniref:Zn(2)-C6 fungal-type domain-containing protein n=1 Tax=Pyricularia oryzae (strain 70-15 / ATCC MYA-4617 / FGSC 8958) TaxID=242507 RepID=G4MLT5_PYRO7|nr:uncharacterized protein MGG_05459 [Pyricularia oryzae 70-15]EHA57713.1 hypothetical protein MGG_05459 [Pyricularia oryzae 70-15]